MATFFPKKAKTYKRLGKSLYETSNNEKLANSASFSCALGFVEQLNKLSNQYLPKNTTKIYGELKTAITLIKQKIKFLEDEIAVEKKSWVISLLLGKHSKHWLLPEVKKDFLKACKMVMVSQQPDQNIANNFALLIRKPEFFDKPTAQKFYEWGKENNLPSVYGALCYVSELDIPDAERKSGEKKYAQIIEYEKERLTNIKIKNSDKEK